MCYIQEKPIGWGEVIPDLDSTVNYVRDYTYNPNLSEEIAYML